MKQLCFVLLVAVGASAAEPKTEKPTREDALSDWRAADAFWKKYGQMPTFRYQFTIDPTSDSGMELLAKVEAFEATDAKLIEALVERMVARYGKTPAEIDSSVYAYLGWKKGKGRAPDDGGKSPPGELWLSLAKGLVNLAESRTQSAEFFLKKAKSDLDLIARSPPRGKMSRFESAERYLQTAGRLDPENEQLPSLKESLTKLRSEVAEQLQARFDAASFPDAVERFSGPGNPTELSEQVRLYLAGDNRWGKAERPERIVVVRIAGDWRVVKVNLLGDPVQWGLPVFVGVHNDAEKTTNLARVFRLTMLTAEAKGVAKAPPFNGWASLIAVDNPYEMRLSNMLALPDAKKPQ